MDSLERPVGQIMERLCPAVPAGSRICRQRLPRGILRLSGTLPNQAGTLATTSAQLSNDLSPIAKPIGAVAERHAAKRDPFRGSVP